MKLMNSRFLPVIFYLILLTTLLVERLSMSIGSVPHSNETHSHLQIFQVMVVVPTTVHFDGYCKYQLPKWERGEEIFPGAHIVVSEINGSPEILRDFQLEIVAIKVPICVLPVLRLMLTLLDFPQAVLNCDCNVATRPALGMLT